jgi:ariadne-1
MLHAFDWSVEDAIASLLDNPSSAKRKAGIVDKADADEVIGTDSSRGVATPAVATLTATAPAAVTVADAGANECTVCLSEPGEDGVVFDFPELGCGHKACRSCWTTYVNGQISEGNYWMQCLGQGCSVSVGHSVLKMVLSESGQQQYRRLLHDALVTSTKALVWCPTADCGTVVKAEASAASEATLGSVECRTCRSSFCFDCGVEHQPALCSQVKAFNDKCAKDGEDIGWLVQNTKECPKCAAFIEKNGGCNWIKCYRCKFEFCWLCSRAMKHNEVDAAGGSHKCNVFKEGEDLEITARVCVHLFTIGCIAQP